MTDKHVKKFLEELSELSKKYQLSIGGCGCCGSPFLEKIPDENTSQNFGYRLEALRDPKDLDDLKYVDLKRKK